MRRWPVALAVICALVLAGAVLVLQRDRSAPEAPAFDHYLLALTWMPGWCATTGDDRDDARCAPGSGTGWALHGLWPQHATGWPEFCDSTAAAPRPADLAPVAEIMGSTGLAQHQWRKHGTCTGLTPEAYFHTSRAAWDRVALPDAPPGAGRDRLLPADLLAAFAAANAGLEEGMAVVTCRDGRLQEVRLCLTQDLDFRSCGADVLARACRRPVAADPLR